jgi:hypothetical protein
MQNIDLFEEKTPKNVKIVQMWKKMSKSIWQKYWLIIE